MGGKIQLSGVMGSETAIITGKILAKKNEIMAVSLISSVLNTTEGFCSFKTPTLPHQHSIPYHWVCDYYGGSLHRKVTGNIVVCSGSISNTADKNHGYV